jgi:hypothetical protein
VNPTEVPEAPEITEKDQQAETDRLIGTEIHIQAAEQIQIKQQGQIFKRQNTYQLQIIKRFIQLQAGVKVKQLFKKHQRQISVERQILRQIKKILF